MRVKGANSYIQQALRLDSIISLFLAVYFNKLWLEVQYKAEFTSHKKSVFQFFNKPFTIPKGILGKIIENTMSNKFSVAVPHW